MMSEDLDFIHINNNMDSTQYLMKAIWLMIVIIIQYIEIQQTPTIKRKSYDQPQYGNILIRYSKYHIIIIF